MIEINLDLTKAEMDSLKGEPSGLGLCAYFPYGEFFLQTREVMDSTVLPIGVKNIKPGSPMTTRPAHF
jgi:hypothetical protein